jgi:hypothetical protein
MNYNPVRVFGLIGLGRGGLRRPGAGLGWCRPPERGHHPGTVGRGRLVLGAGRQCRDQPVCPGSTFNYLVSLFYQRPIRQGLFGPR